MNHLSSKNQHVQFVVHLVLRLTLVLAAFSYWFVDTATAVADDTEKTLPDKSAYTLINPTPHNLMRELTPDRPDKTESPYTVDAGHYQLEMSFVEFTKSQSDGVRT